MLRFQELRGFTLRLAIWVEACLGVMTFGYNQSSAGGVLTGATFNRQFPRIDTITTSGATQAQNSKLQGTVVSLYTLCGTFGALSCIWLGDLLGRRKVIFLASIVQSIGCVLQSSAFGLAQLIVGRIILGLGTGGIIATVSVWQSELSKAESRGKHVTAFGTFCGLGNSLALWVAFGMSFTQPSSASWRFPLALSIFLSVLVCSSILMLPESPRWLSMMGHWQEARDVLARLYHDDPDSGSVCREIENIQLSLERGRKLKMGDLLRMGPQRVFHRVVLAAVVQIFLQMTGVNIVVYYSPTIYEQQLHFSHVESGILSAASQAVLVLGSLCCSFTVDRFGRRKLMLFSACADALSLAAIAGLTAHPENSAGLKASAFFIYLYYFVYVIGFFGIPFLYASEIAPTHLRAAVCGVSTAVSWLFNFVVAEVTPVAFTNIGWKYFIVYCCLNAAFVPLVYFFYPETAGRSLEEIDQIFEASKSVFDTVSLAEKLPKCHSADSPLTGKSVTAKHEEA